MGRIRNMDYNGTGQCFVMNINTNPITGYQMVTLLYNGKMKGHLLHRLILSTFNPIKDLCEYQVDHINSIRDDNRLENLRWVSRKENNSTKHSKEMRSKNNKHISRKNEYIKGVFEDGSIDYFKNIIDASEKIGCSTTLVVQALKPDRQWKAKGWKLEYISKDAEECKTRKEEFDRIMSQKIQERDETKRKKRLQRKEAKRLLRIQRKVIRRIEKRISIWNNHTSVIPTDAKERNLKKLGEMLIQEQNRLRIFEEKIVNAYM